MAAPRSCCRRRGAARAAVVVLCALLAITGVSAELPAPSWQRCDDDALAVCANITTYSSWKEPGAGEYYYSYAVKKFRSEGNTTVWYLGDHLTDNWVSDLVNNDYNVVRLFLRGMDRTWPRIRCSEAHYSRDLQCIPNATCADEIRASGVDVSRFSVTETAYDLIWAINNLGTARNVVVAEGVGTFVAHRMISLSPNMEKVAVILADYTNPLKFDAYRSILSFDAVAQRVMGQCEQVTSCVARLGADEGAWNRLVNVLQAAAEGQLPCLKSLKWNVKDPAKTVRHIVSVMLKRPQNFLMSSDRNLIALLPSFIYRIQRCNSDDIRALDTLHDRIKTVTDTCPLDTPHHYNWLLNDCMLSPPPHPDELIASAAQSRFILPNETFMHSLYDLYSAMPHYNASADNTLTNPNFPLALLSVDLDPFFPETMASTLSLKYTGAVNIRLASTASSPVAQGASTCIKQQMSNYRVHNRFLSAEESGCVSTDSPLNFIGVDGTNYYTLSDAWGFTEPNPAQPITGTQPTPAPSPTPECKGSSGSGGAVVLGLLFALTFVALVGVSYLLYRRMRATKFSDDFYSSLNRYER